MNVDHYRRHAAPTMPDRCRISDPPQVEATVDRVSLAASRAAGELVYEGRCRFNLRESSRLVDDGAGEQLAVDELVLVLPLSAVRLQVGQLVTVVAADVVDLEWPQEGWEIVRLDGASSPVTRAVYCRRVASRSVLAGVQP